MWTDEDSASRVLAERASRVLPGGSTRAAVWMSPYPPYVARGQGAYVYDVDGNGYLDLTNNLGVLIHGHARPEVTEVLKEQIHLGTCFALPTPHEVKLAELLCERVAGFERVRFINTGSEAVALAIKTARAFTGRPKIVKLEGVYHGSYDFAEVSNASTPEVWGNEPMAVATVPGTPQGVLDNVLVMTANDLDMARRMLRDHGSEIAAVLVDPVPPRCGMQPLDTHYLEGLRALTREIGALLIFDEVIALRFAYEGAQGRWGGDPDLTALGKIIGGGLPVGAVAGRAEVMEATAAGVASSGTFTANPLSMRAGLACMSLLDRSAIARLDEQGERVRGEMTRMIDERSLEMQVCGTGSITSIYFHKRDVRDYRSYYKAPEEVALTQKLHRAMLEHGVLIAPTATVFSSTAVEDAEEERLLTAFRQSLGEL